MKGCTGMIAVAGALGLVFAAVGEEPKVPSATHVEIRCPLPGTSVVRSVVKDGSRVKKGDVLLTFDDSKIRAEVERLRVEASTAEAEAVAAKASLQLAESQSEEVGVAEAALKVAELRRRCCSPRFELELKLLEVQIEVAKKSLALSKRRYEKVFARQRATGSGDVEAAELEIVKTQAELETAMTKRELLKLMHALNEAELELALKRMQLDLAKTKCTVAEELETAKAALRAREQTRQLRQARLKRVADLLEQCTVRAPQDGTVRYLRRGGMSKGASVRQGQPLLIFTGENHAGEDRE